LADREPSRLIKAEFALNEGGRVRIVGGKRLYVAVQNTEKVPHTVTVTARGPGGHASMPLAGNAILRLGRALAQDLGLSRSRAGEPDDARVLLAARAVWPNRDERVAMADVASRRRTASAARRARPRPHGRVRRRAPQRHLGHDPAERYPQQRHPDRRDGDAQRAHAAWASRSTAS
jgi:hypothetical protein